MSPPLSPADYIAAVNNWLVWLQHNRGRSASTADLYHGVLLRLSRWCTEPPEAAHLRASTTNPFELEADDLERFVGLYCHSQGLSSRSRRVYVSALRGFYAWASKKDLVSANLAEQLPYPKAGRKLPRALTLSNADLILRQPDLSTFLGLRDTAIMSLLMGIGLRVSGVCALNESGLIWTHLDGAEELVLRAVEKGSKERLLPVPRESALLLRAYLGHPDLAGIDRTLPNGDQVLFVTVANRMVAPWDYHGEARRISEYTVRDLLAKHGTAAKIPADQLNPHAMRHLFGAEMAESDINLLDQQALLGHADPSSTEIYAHLAMRKLRTSVVKANPLGKLRSPVLEDLRQLDAVEQRSRTSPRPKRA